MIAAERVALLLLAAGRSIRFGDTPKLLAPLAGLPLGLHAAHAVAAMPFGWRVAVTGAVTDAPDYAGQGFALVENPDPAQGLSSSLALGIAAIERTAAEAVLVMLADMPLMTADHIAALLAAGDGQNALVASAWDEQRSPPALFGRAHFAALMAASGDAGARPLLQKAAIVQADDPAILADVDTPGDLAAIAARLIRGEAHQSG